MATMVSGSDVYGSSAERLVGTKSQTTAVNASGSVGNVVSPNTNGSFSWVIFALVLIFIRVLEEFAPSA